MELKYMPACILGSEGLQNIVQKHFSEKHRYLRTYSGKKGLLQKSLFNNSAAAPCLCVNVLFYPMTAVT